MLEVDVTEEAKQVARYRYELTGELYDDDEIRSFYEDDIVSLDAAQREEITFESWLQEYLRHGVFYDEEKRGRAVTDRRRLVARGLRINFETLHDRRHHSGMPRVYDGSLMPLASWQGDDDSHIAQGHEICRSSRIEV